MRLRHDVHVKTHTDIPVDVDSQFLSVKEEIKGSDCMPQQTLETMVESQICSFNKFERNVNPNVIDCNSLVKNTNFEFLAIKQETVEELTYNASPVSSSERIQDQNDSISDFSSLLYPSVIMEHPGQNCSIESTPLESYKDSNFNAGPY